MRYGDPGHVPRYSWENRGGGFVRWRFELISSLVERIGSVRAFVGFESELTCYWQALITIFYLLGIDLS